jgi:hypothetical protein
MTDERFNRILTINKGSSTVELALVAHAASEMLMLSGKIDRIGLSGSHLEMKDADGKVMAKRELSLPNHETALKALLDWLQDHIRRHGLDAVGHRLVHGGVKYTYPHRVTPEFLASLTSTASISLSSPTGSGPVDPSVTRPSPGGVTLKALDYHWEEKYEWKNESRREGARSREGTRSRAG